MAKMFYTLEEAAAKLGMTEGEVQNLAESGQLQEFRDRERLMFKVDQVELLAGDEGDEDIQLADTGSGLDPISLSSSNTGTGLSMGDSNPNEGTGVSIFDPEDADAADANAETLVTSGLGGSGFAMDAGASGSGLAQLAFEPDDTSLGTCWTGWTRAIPGRACRRGPRRARCSRPRRASRTFRARPRRP